MRYHEITKLEQENVSDHSEMENQTLAFISPDLDKKAHYCVITGTVRLSRDNKLLTCVYKMIVLLS